jgi:hypothetical protein
MLHGKPSEAARFAHHRSHWAASYRRALPTAQQQPVKQQSSPSSRRPDWRSSLRCPSIHRIRGGRTRGFPSCANRVRPNGASASPPQPYPGGANQYGNATRLRMNNNIFSCAFHHTEEAFSLPQDLISPIFYSGGRMWAEARFELGRVWRFALHQYTTTHPSSPP